MVNGQRTTCGSWFSSSNYMDLRDPTALVMGAFAGLALSLPLPPAKKKKNKKPDMI